MLSKYQEEISKCRYCKDDFGFEPNPILWGKENSKILQISQAPSKTVHETAKPFSDASGRTLRNDWYEITDEEFYNISNFYIVSLAHCYPGKDKNGNDRKPPKCCLDKWIKKEIEMVNNEIYIFLGAKAAQVFFEGEKFEELVFKNSIYNNKMAIVLPHPSPLNKKWIKDHPDFLNKRMIEVRKIIREIINN